MKTIICIFLSGLFFIMLVNIAVSKDAYISKHTSCSSHSYLINAANDDSSGGSSGGSGGSGGGDSGGATGPH